jgi:5-methylcytosine-specific restriction endonuclease McrA
MDYRKLEPFKDILLLNADYNPISIIKWKRAVVLLFKNRVKFISKRVVRLLSYIKIPHHRLLSVRPTKNLIKKYCNYQCSYCGSIKDLTIDHIIPLSRGGSHSFDNLTCACLKCNAEKGNRTPEEWGTPLYTRPYKPFSKLEVILKTSNVDEWLDYVYT